MANNLGPQPDFAVVVNALQTITDEFGHLPNLPTLREGNAILTAIQDMERRFQAQQLQQLQQLQAMEERLSGQIQSLSNRVSAAEHNTKARFQNTGLRGDDTELTVLHTMEDDPIENFPESTTALQQLTGPMITRLLVALKMSTSGSVEQKRARLRLAIGLQEIVVTIR